MIKVIITIYERNEHMLLIPRHITSTTSLGQINLLGCSRLSTAPFSNGEKKEASLSPESFTPTPATGEGPDFVPPHNSCSFFFFHILFSWCTWKMKRPASLQQSGAHGAEDTKAGPQGPNWHTDYDRTLGLM